MAKKSPPASPVKKPASPSKAAKPAEEPIDTSDIPIRYIKGCLGDVKEARRRWDLTLKWREEFGTDAILEEAFPELALIKECYPHFIHRRAKDGNLLYFERLGKINIAKLREKGVSMERLTRYYIFMTEFMWTHLDPREEAKVVTVMDVEGVGLKDLRGEALEFIRLASDLMQMHYVERSCRILVINAPFLFHLVWSVVSPWINERTREKISIVGTHYKDELLKHIDESSLPREYGGKDVLPLMGSDEEVRFRDFAAERCRAATTAAASKEEAATGAGGTLNSPPEPAERAGAVKAAEEEQEVVTVAAAAAPAQQQQPLAAEAQAS